MYTLIIVRPSQPTVDVLCKTQQQVKTYLSELDFDDCSAIHILFT